MSTTGKARQIEVENIVWVAGTVLQGVEVGLANRV